MINFVGLGLMCWSPISFGINLGEKQEDAQALIAKIMVRVSTEIIKCIVKEKISLL